VLSFRYVTPSVSARRFTRFHPTAAATIDRGHHTAVRPPPSEGGGGRTLRRALACRALATVTESPAGARVAGVARAAVALVTGGEDHAAVQVPGAGTRVTPGDDLRAVRAQENPHLRLLRRAINRLAGDRAAAGCRAGLRENRDLQLDPHRAELGVRGENRLPLVDLHQHRAVALLGDGICGGNHLPAAARRRAARPRAAAR